MTSIDPTPNPRFSGQSASKTDQLVAEYAGRWSGIKLPDEVEFLGLVDKADRSLLLRELLRIKREALAKFRCVPSRSDYEALYPDHIDEIDQALAIAAPSTVKEEGDHARTIDSTMDVSMETVSLADSYRETSSVVVPVAGPRYRVIRDHAKGGLGQVSVARDQELDREVALKEIQDRFADDATCRQRFVTEAQVTGQLEHPGIVPVYGFGVHANGRPFYAMRFIQGESLKEAIHGFHQSGSSHDYGSLEFRQLLRRFVDVCNAVEFAHSRDVIHRDIKPANVMLGDYGETLLVDWGLAKRASAESASETAPCSGSAATASGQTHDGSRIGTPSFMSPEQAAGDLNKVGASSDVYSLGATLFFLLTDRAPVKSSRVEECLDHVVRGDVLRPREVNSRIPKPLAAVCRKAMARDIGDRYDTAAELAREIDRWLADEPVNAFPEPFSARLWRWVRKHRIQVVSAAIVLLIALVSLGIVLAIVTRTNRDLGLANGQLAEAKAELEVRNGELVDANVKIQAAQEKATEERDTAIAINQFVCRDLLGQSSPEKEPDRDVKLRTILDRAAEKIGTRFEDQPLVEAAITQSIGDAYLALGELVAAEPHLQRSKDLRIEHSGYGHPESWDALNRLADLYHSQGRFAEAEPLYEQALANVHDVIGSDHAFGLPHLNNLAGIYYAQDRYEEAKSLYERALEMSRQANGDEHEMTIAAMHNVALVYSREGRMDEAEELYEQSYALAHDVLGEFHPSTLTASQSMAAMHEARGRNQQALEEYERTRAEMQRVLGEDHPDTLSCQYRLASLLLSLRRVSEAEALNEEVRRGRRDKLGEEHPDTLASENLAALILLRQNKLEESEAIQERIVEIARRVLGPESPRTLTMANNLAFVYRFRGRFDESETLLVDTLALRKRVLGEEHIQTIESLYDLSRLYDVLGRYDEAVPGYERSLEIRLRDLGEQHPRTVEVLGRLAEMHGVHGQYDKAISLYEREVDIKRRLYGESHEMTATAMYNLAQMYGYENRWEEAAATFEETLVIERDSLGSNNPSVWLTMRKLAGAYESLEQWLDAENLRLEVIRRSQAAQGESVELLEDLGHLVELYVSSDQPAKAAEWRAKKLEMLRRLAVVLPPEPGAQPPAVPLGR